uniref:Uncharacterized protein n=1 Tax=Neobodo designis TaxID=312471 RepID=A0A7S1W7U3_NEODS|mmetsp:Transcript_5919/g.18677  ORF Transcript_5919/g.18677 Transcript_5919/m.18677 type:complete len:270 (+) Transcript_5919:43-852(+)
MSVVNPVAIVTGGAQGIGRGIVAGLLADAPRRAPFRGGAWRVVAVDFSDAGIADAKRHFAVSASGDDESDRVVFLQGDCGEDAVAEAAVSAAVARFGRVDLVVNNAGGGGLGTPFAEQTRDGFLKSINSNLTAAYTFSHAAAPQLRASKGSIVNISSTRAFQSEANSEPYAAAKGGIVGLTHALAVSLGPDVTVNCVCPGWIDVTSPEWGPGRTQYEVTDADKAQHPCGRIGTPEDVCDAVLYLASAKFVTGQTLTVDGGMSKRMIYEE